MAKKERMVSDGLGEIGVETEYWRHLTLALTPSPSPIRWERVASVSPRPRRRGNVDDEAGRLPTAAYRDLPPPTATYRAASGGGAGAQFSGGLAAGAGLFSIRFASQTALIWFQE